MRSHGSRAQPQCLVRRKQSILLRVSAAADDCYNVKLKTLRENHALG